MMPPYFQTPSSSPVEPPRKIVETEAPLVEAFQVALLEPRQLWQHQPHLVAGASRHPSQCAPVPAGSDSFNLQDDPSRCSIGVVDIEQKLHFSMRSIY